MLMGRSSLILLYCGLYDAAFTWSLVRMVYGASYTNSLASITVSTTFIDSTLLKDNQYLVQQWQ